MEIGHLPQSASKTHPKFPRSKAHHWPNVPAPCIPQPRPVLQDPSRLCTAEPPLDLRSKISKGKEWQVTQNARNHQTSPMEVWTNNRGTRRARTVKYSVLFVYILHASLPKASRIAWWTNPRCMLAGPRLCHVAGSSHSSGCEAMEPVRVAAMVWKRNATPAVHPPNPFGYGKAIQVNVAWLVVLFHVLAKSPVFVGTCL